MGGLVGIICNKSALHRWVLSHHSRALISSQCKIMEGKMILQGTEENLANLILNKMKRASKTSVVPLSPCTTLSIIIVTAMNF